MRTGVLSLVAAVLLTGCSVINNVRVSDEFHQTYKLSGEGRVSLENINGSVRIATWDRGEVKVDAVKWARNEEDLAELKIEVETAPDRVQIRTQPPRRAAGRFWGGNGHGTSIDYVVTVPFHAQLERVSTVNGGVDIDGTRGAVDARTVNGGVRGKKLAGTARLKTVNGGVHAEFAELKEVQSISLESVNGGVSLTLPINPSAELEAKTVNGSIHTDLPVTVTKQFPAGRHLSGKVGEGGPRVRATTVNGGIRIHQN